MKTKILGLLSIVLIYLTSACTNLGGSHTNVSEDNTSDTLTYQYKVLKKSSKHVVRTEKGVDSTYISIRYPQFQKEDIDQFIQKLLLGDDPKHSYKNLDALADSFIRGYEEVINEDKTYQQAWFSEVNIQATQPFPGIISLENLYSSYTGGAHGMYGTSYYNYDVAKHRVLTLQDLFSDENLAKLTARAESIFRKNENLSPQAILKDVYFFENGQFALTKNFQIRENDLLFFYNPYEIKPYAAGTTRLDIPYSVIKDLINKNTIIYKELIK